jgi:hypothetical protein
MRPCFESFASGRVLTKEPFDAKKQIWLNGKCFWYSRFKLQKKQTLIIIIIIITGSRDYSECDRSYVLVDE